jgi:DNA helicase HerA-like ATPase
VPRGFVVTQQPQGWPIGRPEAQKAAVKELLGGHTLIVGQSRSGKTNAARRLFEEVLLWTDIRIVLFDPNGDFRWLNQVDSKTDDKDFAADWNRLAQHIRVLTPDGSEQWGIPWGQLSLDEMAAFLKLDPVETFAEYQILKAHYAFEVERRKKSGTFEKGGLGNIAEFAQSSYFRNASRRLLRVADMVKRMLGLTTGAASEATDRYRLRLETLASRNAWATTPGKDLDSILKGDFRAAVIDLSLDDEEVRAVTIARALEVLWKTGLARRTEAISAASEGRAAPLWPITVVAIDEAHMFAGPGPFDPQRRLVSERIERLADQGKKFNLYLFLVTQQPGKLNQRILAECNNRIILRMNERVSLELLEAAYGGIRGRYNGALTFRTGEALFEGSLLCDETPPSSMPRGVQFLKARTREGGGNPPNTSAELKDRPG